MKRFLIALQFLTILPVRIKSRIKGRDYGESLFWFPFVGGIIGLSLAMVFFGSFFLPVSVRVILAIILSVVITGGIHLDGFADTCDGFYAGNTRERTLSVMRDSHIGTMGVVGIVFILLMKFALMVNIQEDLLWRALIIMCVFSRWVQSFVCYVSSYPRKEGKAKSFIEHASLPGVIIGGLFTLGLSIVLTGFWGLLPLVIAFLFALFFSWSAFKKIGGMTGDTIGAASEIAEVSFLLGILALN